jgi:hypothetical protein
MTKKDDRPSVCHSCGAAVIWAKWQGGDSNGKTIPIEECPEGEGRVYLQPSLIAGINPTASASTSATRYRRHIETCPQGQAWRDAWKGSKPERQFPARKGATPPASFSGQAPERKKP